MALVDVGRRLNCNQTVVEVIGGRGSSGSAAVDIFVLHRKDNHEGYGDWKYIGAAIAAGLIAEVGQD
ncbi:hypothetical protein L2E82_18481 [Cichorium intybus]|uniref:Uncharacterized protein n=1 Tax=Cichorium intybus TaxID=13427 RepID=A0ACB9FB32_CICIN|nr:hypothetical protein L2E82_18481 [Cichorium intybus]